MGKIRIEDKRLVFQRKDELTVIEPYGRLSALPQYEERTGF